MVTTWSQTSETTKTSEIKVVTWSHLVTWGFYVCMGIFFDPTQGSQTRKYIPLLRSKPPWSQCDQRSNREHRRPQPTRRQRWGMKMQVENATTMKEAIREAEAWCCQLCRAVPATWLQRR